MQAERKMDLAVFITKLRGHLSLSKVVFISLCLTAPERVYIDLRSSLRSRDSKGFLYCHVVLIYALLLERERDFVFVFRCQRERERES